VTSSARHATVVIAAVTTGQGWLFQRLGFEEFNLEVRMIEYRRLLVVSRTNWEGDVMMVGKDYRKDSMSNAVIARNEY
jgi:hypothetical protein